MRAFAAIGALVLLSGLLWARGHRRSLVEPDQFIIAESSFWDMGPPFGSYDLFVVRPSRIGTAVERVSLTPAGGGCCDMPELRTASKTMNQSVASLLWPVNPCAISERDLAKEMRRRKKGLVFSGADIVMQVQCGSKTRLIRADVLDRDMFDGRPNTPRYTSWTMRLLGIISQGLGPGPMDRPIFSISGDLARHLPKAESQILSEVSAGKFDGIFSPGKLSDLYYKAIQPPPPPPEVVLVKSVPHAPIIFVKPHYPPIAVLARLQGTVRVKVAVDGNGRPGVITFESGNPLFRSAVKEAVDGWKFPKGSPNRQFEASFTFKLHCTNPMP